MRITKTLAACLLPLALMATPAIATAAPNLPLLNSILTQERAWAGLQTRTVMVDGINAAYSEGGPANGPKVLLIHGFSGSRDNWNRVAHQLTRKYHVYALDLPGHGDTAAPDTFDFQLANQMEFTRKFVTTLGIEKNLHVAGHSMGGAIAALYAAMYFLEVRSLLLVDSAGVYANNGKSLMSDPKQLTNLLVRKPGDLKVLLTKYAMYDPPLIPEEVLEAQEKVQMDHIKWHEKLMATLLEQMKWYTPDTFQLAVRSIEAPTLVVWGDKDAIIDVAAADELKKNLKRSESLILPNIGHTPILEADQIVSAAYLKFLEKAEATPNPFAPKP
ncbi:triacylglycerol lipase [Fluviicoccus keumensis]|uniref:Triacylglycerol lipase n=1 Tax=Fluviicoccus keumensis TaxID=1435465 RepID=A0A4Q7YMU9_9GAMM|nr:alpha/beta hydrolase [Fluviicoccus keumensis]RZU38131.1 triacylglycerol lipase [Fluviicoccus keumensis]